jgi:Myb-like DNA-binding domain
MGGDAGPTSPAVDKPWTREEDKAFETALATSEVIEELRRWEGIAARVPARSVEEIKRHYELLVDDVKAIEEGRIELPRYGAGEEEEKERGGGLGLGLGFDRASAKALSRSEQERRKGIPWTEEEHRLIFSIMQNRNFNFNFYVQFEIWRLEFLDLNLINYFSSLSNNQYFFFKLRMFQI